MVFNWTASADSYGTLTSGNDGGPISSITGIFNGASIVGLVSSTLVPGVPDNVLYFPAVPHLDFDGIAFETSSGSVVNIWHSINQPGYYAGSFQLADLITSCNDADTCTTMEDNNFSVENGGLRFGASELQEFDVAPTPPSSSAPTPSHRSRCVRFARLAQEAEAGPLLRPSRT
jgi:hypothetical protein